MRKTSGQSRIRFCAFTFAELIVGMVVTTIVLAAGAAILCSVAQGWSAQETTQSTQLQAYQVYHRLQSIFAQAKYIGYVSPGSVTNTSAVPGAVFFWANDSYIADHAIEAGECAYLVQDPTTNSIYLYQAIPASQMTATQQSAASTVLHLADLNNPSTAAAFETYSFVTKTCIAGPGSDPDSSGRIQVNALQIQVNGLSTMTQMPVMEFAILCSKNGVSFTIYNTATMRGAATQPS